MGINYRKLRLGTMKEILTGYDSKLATGSPGGKESNRVNSQAVAIGSRHRARVSKR
jgi:hypothetical protein